MDISKNLTRITSMVLAALLAMVGMAVVLPQKAEAAPRVSITNVDFPDRGATADHKYLSKLRLSGTGFQSIQNGFGGIYVMFGWVDSSWRPSQGGMTGQNYKYVYDDESNPVGYQLFVTFPGSSTAYAANGGTLAADGTWSATISIPGPKFSAYDRSGNVSTVDCTQVQCGIITMGAHGVKNGANETFTPINFADLYDAAGKEGQQAAAAPSGGLGAQPGGSGELVAPSTIAGRPAIVPSAVDASALVADADGGVTAEVGASRVVVTVPGVDAEEWIGLSIYPSESFVGWFHPNSQGQLDLNVPSNIEPGEYQVVAQSESGELIGWADFTWQAGDEEEPAPVDDPTEEPSAPAGSADTQTQGTDTVAAADSDSNTLLNIAVIAILVLALASVIVLAFVFMKVRRAGASPTGTEGS